MGMGTAALAVEASGLFKEYSPGAPPALRGIDLSVEPGRFVSIMGPSGSGKSTLLHIVGGLERATEGSVRLGGTSLDGLGDRQLTELRRTSIGFVFQAFNLVPVLTVAENVALPAVIAGRPPRRYRGRVDEVIDLVGLSGQGEKIPGQLSGGEQQRVAIARALLLEPPLLLADEPTGNLDSATGAVVLDLLCQAAIELGTTVVMVTHDPKAAAHGDTVLLLSDGLVVGRLDLGGPHEERVAQVHALIAPQSAMAPPARRRSTRAAATQT